MRLIVPAYAYPATNPRFWTAIREASDVIGSVIVNPGSGPGHVRDHVWVAEIDRLRAAAVPLLGYVDLAYGTRTPRDLAADVRRWRTWYGIGDIFGDCAPSHDPAATARLVGVLRASAPTARLAANPGTLAAPDVAAAYDAVTESEGTMSTLRAVRAAAPRWPVPDLAGPDRSWILYAAPRVEALRAIGWAREGGVEQIWVTDLDGANPYRDLPSYWTAVIAALRDPAAASA